MFDYLTEPLTHVFMQNALIAALCVSAVCAVLSCFVVLKGWSLMGDAISHGVFPGVVVAAFFELPYMLGAFVAGLICAFLVGFLKNHTRIKEDTLMGIVFSGMFAVGLLGFSKMNAQQHLSHILFGNLLGVSSGQLWQMAGLSLTILAIIAVKRKDLMLYAFDSSQARIAGLRVEVLHYGLLVLLCAAIVVAMNAVGVILVVAMLISPGMTAFLLTRRFDIMLVVAVVSACLSSGIGVLLSYYLDAATGPSIVLCQGLLFVLALVYQKWLDQRRRQGQI